jgi:RecJ-like exonuclease
MTKCSFCGEHEGTEKISNPNLNMGDEIDWSDQKNWWMVCKDCKDSIRAMQGLDIATFMKDAKMAAVYQKEIETIANRTKTPILSARIEKKKDGTLDITSVEYTGKGDNNEQ